jgi:hypothetical protein
MRERGGFGFLGAFHRRAQTLCGEGVYGDWVDIDSPRKRSVELGSSGKDGMHGMQDEEMDFPYPAFPRLSGILAGPGSKHASARSATSTTVPVDWLSVPGKEA